MSDPSILFVKPKAINARDKKALAAAGVIIVEVEDVANVKFTRAHAELSGGDMLAMALKTINEAGGPSLLQKFGALVIDSMIKRSK